MLYIYALAKQDFTTDAIPVANRFEVLIPRLRDRGDHGVLDIAGEDAIFATELDGIGMEQERHLFWDGFLLGFRRHRCHLDRRFKRGVGGAEGCRRFGNLFLLNRILASLLRLFDALLGGRLAGEETNETTAGHDLGGC